MLDTDDLNQVQGLMRYLDDAFSRTAGHDLDAVVELHNSNGDKVGVIVYSLDLDRHVCHFLSPGRTKE